MNIYLIGMPLSGKTTLGKITADKLNMDFIDIDNVIVNNVNKSISDIFKDSGEEYFRKLESSTLGELKKVSNKIISTGGGIVLNKDNLKLFNGLIIYLKVDVDELEKRVNNDKQRPLLDNHSLKLLYDLRKEKYLQFSDIVIENHDITKSVKDIVNIIKDYEKSINS